MKVLHHVARLHKGMKVVMSSRRKRCEIISHVARHPSSSTALHNSGMGESVRVANQIQRIAPMKSSNASIVSLVCSARA